MRLQTSVCVLLLVAACVLAAPSPDASKSTNPEGKSTPSVNPEVSQDKTQVLNSSTATARVPVRAQHAAHRGGNGSNRQLQWRGGQQGTASQRASKGRQTGTRARQQNNYGNYGVDYANNGGGRAQYPNYGNNYGGQSASHEVGGRHYGQQMRGRNRG